MMLRSLVLPVVTLAGFVLAAPPFSPSLARFNVAANEGNASSPYAYGIMNEEVWLELQYSSCLLILDRSTMLVTEDL
jgi:hypothetical protein